MHWTAGQQCTWRILKTPTVPHGLTLLKYEVLIAPPRMFMEISPRPRNKLLSTGHIFTDFFWDCMTTATAMHDYQERLYLIYYRSQLRLGLHRHVLKIFRQCSCRHLINIVIATEAIIVDCSKTYFSRPYPQYLISFRVILLPLFINSLLRLGSIICVLHPWSPAEVRFYPVSQGQVNLRDAVRRECSLDDPKSGKHYELGPKVATLLVRGPQTNPLSVWM